MCVVCSFAVLYDCVVVICYWIGWCVVILFADTVGCLLG